MLLAAYPLLKSAHMALVGASVLLFVLRGVATLADARWPMNPGVRWTSVAIDTALLLAGVSLWGLLGTPLTGQAWLGVKLLLLPVYVVLGSYRAQARAGPGRQGRVFRAGAGHRRLHGGGGRGPSPVGAVGALTASGKLRRGVARPRTCCDCV